MAERLHRRTTKAGSPGRAARLPPDSFGSRRLFTRVALRPVNDNPLPRARQVRRILLITGWLGTVAAAILLLS